MNQSARDRIVTLSAETECDPRRSQDLIMDLRNDIDSDRGDASSARSAYLLFLALKVCNVIAAGNPDLISDIRSLFELFRPVILALQPSLRGRFYLGFYSAKDLDEGDIDIISERILPQLVLHEGEDVDVALPSELPALVLAQHTSEALLLPVRPYPIVRGRSAAEFGRLDLAALRQQSCPLPPDSVLDQPFPSCWSNDDIR